MSRQLSLFNYMAKKACIEIQDEDEATTSSANERVQSSQSMETNHEGTNETETISNTCPSSSVEPDDIALLCHLLVSPLNVTFPKRASSDKGRPCLVSAVLVLSKEGCSFLLSMSLRQY